MMTTNRDTDLVGLPPDHEQTIRRARLQPRTSVTGAIRGQHLSPWAGTARANRGKLAKDREKVKFRVGTLNVGTMRKRSGEVVETVTRRGVDLCCLQETRFRGEGTRILTGKDSQCKFFWKGNENGEGGMGILLAENWIEKVIDVKRVSDRIMYIKLVIGENVLCVVCVYAPQCGLEDAEKDKFYDELLAIVSKFDDKEIVVVAGDYNGHVGKSADGYEGVHGGHGYGVRNPEGDRILEFADATEMIVANTAFQKRDSRLVTYQSGTVSTQIDYILVRKGQRKMVKDVKVIPGEECALQHKLVLCDMRLTVVKEGRRPFIPRRRVWKLKGDTVRQEFLNEVKRNVEGKDRGSVEEIWFCLKESLLEASDHACGWTKGAGRKRVTWWWNDEVDSAVKEKRRLWKEWKAGGSKERYLEAKRKARSMVNIAKSKAEQERFPNIMRRDDEKGEVFKMAKQIVRRNQDIVGDKCVKDDSGSLAFTDKAKKEAWKEHYNRLLNEEFEWDKTNLSPADPVAGPAVWIEKEWVAKAIDKMKSGKAAGPSGVVIEMLKSAGDVGVELVTELSNAIVSEGSIPRDWEISSIINIYKGKGEALIRGNFRGLKLLEHSMKVVERIVDKLIREIVHIDDMQFGFVPGRGTTDAIFLVRQLQEKYLAKRKNLYFGFVDLEKAFDRVPREVVWWGMRKLGVDEWIVRIIQAMYSNARSRVRVNGTYSEEFGVRVGVHQGSVLSPLLFIMVLEALSREFRTGCPWELLYADDLVLIAESMDELMEKLNKWKAEIEAKGLRMNLKKTKVMVTGHDLKPVRKSGRWPCPVCSKGVGRNSIRCGLCRNWVHGKCSGIKGRLKEDPSFKCKRCLGEIRAPAGIPSEPVIVGNEAMEVVDKFCYLGDMIGAGGGAEDSIIARIRSGWKTFRDLLPVLGSRVFSLRTKGRVFQACVRSVVLYGSETWPVKEADLVKLERNDMRMVRWICGVILRDRKSSEELRDRLGIFCIRICIRKNTLRWFGHIERMEDECWVKKSRDLVVEGRRSRGRPVKTWNEVVREDLRALGLHKGLAQDRLEWKLAIH